MKDRYLNTIRIEMRDQFHHGNVMEVPKLTKIVVNMGVGDSQTEPRLLEAATTELGLVTGQKPAIRKARQSIAGFKVRAGAKIACMVTLRGDRMYEFMDRLFNVVIPRIRDFRGVPPTSFDKDGNYTLGLREQTIFPELNIDTIARVRGMNISFVIANARTVEESRELLRKFGMPFKT
jgi:large subunit ribosomal protein L5